MGESDHQTLVRDMAVKYIWWMTPEEASRRPERVLAQVMDLGDFDDVQALSRAVGEDRLREVLVRAEAGWFRPRSWAYWHHRLGLTEAGGVPPLPVRRFA